MRRAHKSLCCAFTFVLLTSAAPAIAQGIAPGSGEAAGTFGYAHVYGVTSDNHFTFGGSGSYNFAQTVAAGFEYNYTPLGSETISGVNNSGHLQTFGAVVRYSFAKHSRAVPYALAGFGGISEKAFASAGRISASASQGGFYFALGAGASLFAAPSWGIRPEVRFARQQFSADTQFTSFGENDIQATVSLFYQFGGR